MQSTDPQASPARENGKAEARQPNHDDSVAEALGLNSSELMDNLTSTVRDPLPFSSASHAKA